jgi:hypothetical protein
MVLTMLYNTQNYWVFGLCPSFCILLKGKAIPVTGREGPQGGRIKVRKEVGYAKKTSCVI